MKEKAVRVTRRTILATFVAAAGLAKAGRAAAGDVSYRNRVRAKGPIGYWPFDESHGPTVRDQSGNGHIGTCRGGVAFGQRGPSHGGHGGGGSAIGLNGTDAFVEVADSAAFSQPSSGKGLTVEAWLRPDLLDFPGQTNENYVHWLGKGQAGEFEWGFRFYSKHSSRPNRISAYIWNATSEHGVRNEGAGAYFQDELQAGAWLHVVGCYDPGDARDTRAGVSIYKNGVRRHGPESSRGARYASYDIHPVHGAAPLRFGTRDQGSYLAGALADIAIYPRVLGADEIQHNFSGA